MAQSEYAIIAEKISKSFPGVKALQDVTLKVRHGQVHGLVGENGAGKSTLIKILMGVYQRDRGSGPIYVHGEKVEMADPIQAEKAGLAAVYQHMMLSPHLSVAENIYLGHQPKKGLLIDWQTMINDARKALDQVGLGHVDPRTPLRRLTPVQQEMTAIAKALVRQAKILIFDEPTALLAEEETQELFAIIRRLRDIDVSVIYISHRLDEIFALCDEVSVLRDGHLVAVKPIDEVDEGDLIRLMVGRKIEHLYYKEEIPRGKVLLDVENLQRVGMPHKASFQLHAGEVLGIFGLVGAGRSELVRTLFGADPKQQAKIAIAGNPVTIRNPADAIRTRVALIPEDRQTQGLAMPLSVSVNANLISGRSFGRLGLLDFGAERKQTDENIKALNIRTPHQRQRVKFLSGGNQQKVVMAKWLNIDAQVLILDEPTVGIDVGAKTEIYKLMAQLLRQDKGIIFVSSYLPELLGVCDRIMVLAEGKITGILDRKDATQERLLELASDLQRGAEHV